MIYRILHTIFRIILIIIGRWRIIGRENVPNSGPLIIVCNHVSYWDPILVACALKRQVHFMAKAELFSYPIFGRILRLLGAFPIKRGESDRNALRAAINLLKRNKFIGIFPEGTRNKAGNVLPFKSGINMIAYKVNCPVLPMAVVNSKKILLGWFVPVEIRIGKPITFPKMEKRPSGEVLANLTEKIQQEVIQLLQQTSDKQ